MGDSGNMFDHDNPFANAHSSRALSWERTKWKEKLAEQTARYEAERADRGELMRQELAAVLEACGALPSGEAPMMEATRQRGWARLLALVGFYCGRGSAQPSVAPPAPVKGRKSKRKPAKARKVKR